VAAAPPRSSWHGTGMTTSTGMMTRGSRSWHWAAHPGSQLSRRVKPDCRRTLLPSKREELFSCRVSNLAQTPTVNGRLMKTSGALLHPRMK
jgi:hypothetical protein